MAYPLFTPFPFPFLPFFSYPLPLLSLSPSLSSPSTDRFMTPGLDMLGSLIEEGYYVAVLRVLGNILPRFFEHTKCLTEDTR